MIKWILTLEIAEILKDILRKYDILKWNAYAPREVYWEIFAKDILNCVYNINLIRTEDIKKNYKAIDLLDIDNKISYQVTVDTTTTKINDTINKFEEEELYKICKVLNFFLVVSSISFPRSDFPTNGEYEFDKDKNIITFNTIGNSLNSKDMEDLQKIKTVLKGHHEIIENSHIESLKEKIVRLESEKESEKRAKEFLEKTIEQSEDPKKEREKIKEVRWENYNYIWGIDP